MSQREILVGSKACSPDEVIQVLKSSPSFGLLHEKWTEFAIHLGIPDETVRKYRKMSDVGRAELIDVISSLIYTWIGKSDKAKLSDLVNALENCDLRNCAELLENEFNYFKLAEKGWNALPKKFGRIAKTSLANYFPELSSNDEFYAYLKGAVIIDLIEGRKPVPFKEELVPPTFSYYVGRSLLTRNFISREIFSYKSRNLTDILLFTGVERSQLSSFVKKYVTPTTTEYLDGRMSAARFMFMNKDKSSDFQKVAEKAGHNVSVHWLEMEGEKFRWIGTMGNISLLLHRRYVAVDQQEIREDEFIEMLENSERSASLPVLISDSPGMGKSALLAQLSRKLKERFADRKIIFLTIADFMKKYKQGKQGGIASGIMSTLGAFTCENEIGEYFLQSKLTSKNGIEVELLLDGFDEVGASDTSQALDIFEEIKLFFPSIRLWVTTRPHLLRKLEDRLNIFGYKIAAFTATDQVQFLTQYWSRIGGYGKTVIEKFEEFATMCLKVIDMESNETEVAAIPLQCYLIGEVYEDQAREFVNGQRKLIRPFNNERWSMAKLLFNKKLQKYQDLFGQGLSEDILVKMHASLSLELIFQEDFNANLFKLFDPIDKDAVLRFGLFEKSGGGNPYQIIHRTIGEYFIAWFAIYFMESRKPLERHEADFLSRFLIQKLLSTDKSLIKSSNSNESHLDACRFTNHVICYFINGLLQDMKPLNDSISHSILRQLSPEALNNIFKACAYSDFLQIFQFFITIIPLQDLGNFISTNFIHLVVQKSSTEFIRHALQHYQANHSMSISEKQDIFIRAVRRGKFTTVEYFTNEEKGFKGLASKTPNLIYYCVENSKHNSDVIINEKVDVIRRLLEIKPELLEETDYEQRTPLLVNGVHVRLLLELIKMKANVLQTDLDGNTVLHLNDGRSHLKQAEYLSLLKVIPNDKIKILSGKLGGRKKDTPLHSLIRWGDVDPEVLEKFKKAGANFSKVDADRYTVLALAEGFQRSKVTTGTLRKLGARMYPDPLKWIGWNGTWLLCCCGWICCKSCCETKKVEEEDDEEGQELTLFTDVYE